MSNNNQNQDRNQEQDLDLEVMMLVREGLYGHGDMKLLSIRTGVSVSALNNIKSGRTKWPRPHTLETIMPYIGLRLLVVKINNPKNKP